MTIIKIPVLNSYDSLHSRPRPRQPEIDKPHHIKSSVKGCDSRFPDQQKKRRLFYSWVFFSQRIFELILILKHSAGLSVRPSVRAKRVCNSVKVEQLYRRVHKHTTRFPPVRLSVCFLTLFFSKYFMKINK